MHFLFVLSVLIIYALIGLLLANYCLKRYASQDSKGFSAIDFFLWPLSTTEELGHLESEGGYTPIINDCLKDGNEKKYVMAMVAFWPFKIFFVAFSILLLGLGFAAIIFFRAIASIIVCLSLFSGFLAVKVLKGQGMKFSVLDDLFKIWIKPIVIVEF